VNVSSGTYVRALAQALGGHCSTLRRTSVGPFSIEEAAPDVDSATLMPAAVALARLPADAVGRVPESIRAGVLALDPRPGEGAA
jgi:tRNA U55 pseudouridine synthase TruB